MATRINTDDREYYRGFDNRKLIETAQEKPTPELAVVLAERLRRQTRWY